MVGIENIHIVRVEGHGSWYFLQFYLLVPCRRLLWTKSSRKKKNIVLEHVFTK